MSIQRTRLRAAVQRLQSLQRRRRTEMERCQRELRRAKERLEAELRRLQLQRR